jgi:hypothetical protein
MHSNRRQGYVTNLRDSIVDAGHAPQSVTDKLLPAKHKWQKFGGCIQSKNIEPCVSITQQSWVGHPFSGWLYSLARSRLITSSEVMTPVNLL